MFSEKALDKLRTSGLIVSEGESHMSKVSYQIAKPTSIPGNSRRKYDFILTGGDDPESNETPCDAPVLLLYLKEGTWWGIVHEMIPGPGPGDFNRRFSSFEDAVDFAFEYYFGDSTLMNPPELLELFRLYDLQDSGSEV